MPCCGQGHDDNVSKAIELFDKIGRESLLLINKNRDKKDETWERAVKINYIAHEGFSMLKAKALFGGEIEDISE